jgi:hypothetical protein
MVGQFLSVVPAQAGTHIPESVVMDPRFRGDDSCGNGSTAFNRNRHATPESHAIRY